MFDSKDNLFAVVLLYAMVGLLFVSAVLHTVIEVRWLFSFNLVCSFLFFGSTDIGRVFIVRKIKFRFFTLVTIVLAFSFVVSFFLTFPFFLWVLSSFSFFYWYLFLFEAFNFFYGYYPCYCPSKRQSKRFSILFNRNESDEDIAWTVVYFASFVAMLKIIDELGYLG